MPEENKSNEEIVEVEIDADTMKETCLKFLNDVRSIIEANKTNADELEKIRSSLNNVSESIRDTSDAVRSQYLALTQLSNCYKKVSNYFPNQPKQINEIPF